MLSVFSKIPVLVVLGFSKTPGALLLLRVSLLSVLAGSIGGLGSSRVLVMVVWSGVIHRGILLALGQQSVELSLLYLVGYGVSLLLLLFGVSCAEGCSSGMFTTFAPERHFSPVLFFSVL